MKTKAVVKPGAFGTRRPKHARCFRPKEKKAARLLEIVGIEKFLTLRDEFGGRSVWIPKRSGVWPCGACGLRDRCIYVWHKQGHTPAAIGGILKLSPKTVTRILRAEAVKKD
ncbi:MAG: hypothetical protein ACHQ2Z_13090 [Elusimicrobiota bacterium]